jgi:hypothetical protein
MEEKFKKDRQIKVEIKKEEDAGTNRKLSLSVCMNHQTTCLPYMTEGELMRVKEALEEYFKSKKIVTMGELRKMEYEGLYKLHKLSDSDAFKKAKVNISKLLILKHDNVQINDAIIYGHIIDGTAKTGVYFFENTLVELITEEEII